MNPRDEEIIDRITTVRAVNNKLWMQLLRLALRHAPAEAKRVLASINANDKTISDLLRELDG